MFECVTFNLKRQCFLGKLGALGIQIDNTWPQNIKLARVLCPTSSQATKVVNKYISIVEKSRKLLDEGTPLDQLGFRHPVYTEDDYSNVDLDDSISLDSIVSNSSLLNSSFEE